MKRFKVNGFDFYHYLYINGCASSMNIHAPVVKFLLSYLTPDEQEELAGKKMDAYCKRKKIPFGQGGGLSKKLMPTFRRNLKRRLLNNPIISNDYI